jgi:hypothetical protein
LKENSSKEENVEAVRESEEGEPKNQKSLYVYVLTDLVSGRSVNYYLYQNILHLNGVLHSLEFLISNPFAHSDPTIQS